MMITDSRNTPAPQRGRVLVVEDDAAERIALEAILAMDFDVKAATNTNGALGLAATYEFDVVVSDYALGPGDTGVQLIDRILSTAPAVQAVLLTGHAEYREVREVQKQARYLVLFKPADPEQLIGWVKNGVIMARLARMKRVKSAK